MRTKWWKCCTPLGFGHANVIVAVPQAWIDVGTMADLDEVAADLRARRGRKMRVATKYLNLTRRFFAQKGVADYRIVESLGATEGAPGAGSAELVVDITTTGATLAANALKILDDGLDPALRGQSRGVDAARLGRRGPRQAATVLTRIAAEEEARTSREIRANCRSGTGAVARRALALEYDATFPMASRRTREIVLHCRNAVVFEIVAGLQALGAQDITVRAFDYLFRPTNALTERLLRRLG